VCLSQSSLVDILNTMPEVALLNGDRILVVGPLLGSAAGPTGRPPGLSSPPLSGTPGVGGVGDFVRRLTQVVEVAGGEGLTMAMVRAVYQRGFGEDAEEAARRTGFRNLEAALRSIGEIRLVSGGKRVVVGNGSDGEKKTKMTIYSKKQLLEVRRRMTEEKGRAENKQNVENVENEGDREH
jgi:hypothetical protein